MKLTVSATGNCIRESRGAEKGREKYSVLWSVAGNTVLVSCFGMIMEDIKTFVVVVVVDSIPLLVTLSTLRQR